MTKISRSGGAKVSYSSKKLTIKIWPRQNASYHSNEEDIQCMIDFKFNKQAWNPDTSLNWIQEHYADK